MPLPKAALSLAVTAAVTAVAVTVAAPAVCLAVVHVLVARHTASAATAARTLTPQDKTRDASSAASVADAAPPKSLPEELYSDSTSYILTCERVVSKPIAAAALTHPVLRDADASPMQQTSFLLTQFLRGTMAAFAWTPQGFFLRRGILSDTLTATFTAPTIDRLAFVAGDVACGVYRVTYRAGAEGSVALSRDRVELSLVAPENTSTRMLAVQNENVHGIVVVEIERTPTHITLVNETWMWRHAVEEPPTLLERPLGRWLHSLTVGWLVRQGAARLTTAVKAKAKAE